MIAYFSATGNSAWVARTLAASLNDQAQPLAEIAPDGISPVTIGGPGQTCVIVFPVHAWRPPRTVLDAARRLHIANGTFTVGIATMAGFCGDAMQCLNRIIPLDSTYSLRMPNNYLLMSGREPEPAIAACLAQARQRLADISAAISARRQENAVRKGPFPRLLTATAATLFNHFVSDRKFHAEAACTSCAACVRLCPLHNISMNGGRPQWHGNCMHCMACIQRCPVEAIQYGRRTRTRARYTCPE